MKNYKRIMFASAARLGDTLFMTPIFHFIKQHSPQTAIDVIAVSPLAGEVLKNNVYLDRVFITPDDQELLVVADDYDAVVLSHPSSKAKHYLSLLNSPLLVPKPYDEATAAGDRSLQLAAELLDLPVGSEKYDYDLFPQREHTEKVKQLLLAKGVDVACDNIVGLHLGCHGLAKKHTNFFKKRRHEKVWPLRNFIKLVNKLHQQYPDLKIVLTGSKEEEALINKLKKKCPWVIGLANQTSILELAALMHFLKCYICSDTGTLHVACAAGVNLIGLFSDATNVNITGPYPPAEHRVIVYEPNLAKLPVEKVLSAVKVYLNFRTY